MITTEAKINVEMEITENLYLISVSLEKYRKWIPGMFMQLSLDVKSASEPWLDGRAFSFASWGNKKALILVRKEGDFTRTLISRAKEGFTGTIRYPFGNFLLNSDSEKVFLSGGAGVSVFLSYLDFKNLNRSDNKALEIFHNTKSSKESLENIYWNRVPEHVKIHQYITDKRDDNFTGRLNPESLFDHINNMETKEFYICGPPVFTDYWIEKIISRGIIPHSEKWIN